MRSSSMRFAPHSAASRREERRLRGARIPYVLTSAITDRFSSSLLAQGRGWLPNQADRHGWPSTLSGKPSCDSSLLKLRVINLVAQHDVTAHEQFPGHGHLGFGPT